MSRLHQLAAAALAASIVALPALARDRSEVRAFRAEHPCPSTGQRRGACPGWQVDHIAPLKCGGADKPINMQWLTVRDHRAKTAAESGWCRYPRAPKPRLHKAQ